MCLDDGARPCRGQSAEEPAEDQVEEASDRYVCDHAAAGQDQSLQITGAGRLLEPTGIAREQVGSPSVPGLLTKPIIDILLQVPNFADEDFYVPLCDG